MAVQIKSVPKFKVSMLLLYIGTNGAELNLLTHHRLWGQQGREIQNAVLLTQQIRAEQSRGEDTMKSEFHHQAELMHHPFKTQEITSGLCPSFSDKINWSRENKRGKDIDLAGGEKVVDELRKKSRLKTQKGSEKTEADLFDY